MNRVATVEPTQVSSTPSCNFPSKFFNPMHRDTPQHLIGRPVRIGTALIDSSNGSAVNYPILRNWLLNPVVTKALSPYQYIRPEFEIQFLVRAGSTLYGAMQVGWYYGPALLLYPNTIPGSEVRYSSAHTHVVSIAASTAVTENIPYCYPFDWYPVPSEAAEGFATAFVQPLTIQSLEAGASTQVDVEVWATCTKIETNAFVAQSFPTEVKGDFNFKTQSTVATAGLVAGAAVLADKAYSSMDAVEGAANSIRDVTKLVKLVKNVKAHNVEAGFPAYGASVGIKDAGYGDLNSLQRQVQLPRLTEMEINHKIDASAYGDTMVHRLADIASCATLVDNFLFTTKEQIETITLDSNHMGYYHKYLMRNFRYFRGRPRYKMWFITSPLLAFRFQISFSPAAGTAIVPANSDVPKMNFLVRGTEEVVVEVPFVRPTPVATAFDNIGVIHIQCTQLATALTTTGNATCVVVVAACMSPDTQYFSIQAPLQARYVAQSLRAMVKEPVTLDFSNSPHIQTSLYDEVETVEELMMRWSQRDTIPSQDGRLGVAFQRNPNDVYATVYAPWGDVCDAMTSMFALTRGSRDFRLNVLSGTKEYFWVSMAQTSSQVSQLGQLANGTQFFRNEKGVAQLIEYTAPYLASNIATSTYDVGFGVGLPLPLDTNLDTTEITQVWSRAGTDYQVFNLNILPQSHDATTAPVIPP